MRVSVLGFLLGFMMTSGAAIGARLLEPPTLPGQNPVPACAVNLKLR